MKKFDLKKIFSKKENLYLALALSFGMLMVFFNPPFAGVPDEGAHFYRAWGVSQGDLLACGDQLNAAALGLPEELKLVATSSDKKGKISLGKIKKALFEKDSQELVPWGGSVCGSNPLGYFPQVTGISLSKVLNIPVLWGFYLGRLFNLLAAVFLTYFALRLLPFGKIIFMLVALLPMTMQQYASLSYDALHISMIFLFTAYVLKLAFGEGKLSAKQLSLLGLASILAANVKFGFIPVMLLLLIIPWKKIGSRKAYWLYVLAIVIVSCLLFLLAQKSSVGSEGAREGVYPMEQLLFVIKNPINFLVVVINTLYKGIIFFFETFLYKPGWLKDSLSPLFYLGTFIGLIFLVRSEQEEVSLSARQRLVIGATFLAGLVFVFLSLYVFWSKVGGDKVQGVQGRYLISISPLIVLAFYKSNFHFRFDWIKKNISLAIAVFSIAVLASAFVSIWSIYYDKSKTTGKYTYDKHLSKDEIASLGTMHVEKKIKQTFVATKKDLQGIKFYLQKGVYFGEADFYLKDEKCERIIRRKELSWKSDEFGSILVNFGAVRDSRNKLFCVEADLRGESLPFRISVDRYQEGKAEAEGNAIKEDFAFDIVYKN